MSRRSPSPEGVGDLLKHDSFGGFEEDENMDNDTPMAGSGDVVADQEDDEFNVTLDEQTNGDEMKDSEPAAVEDPAGRGSRQPIPHFPTPSFNRGSGNENARYFIIKSNNSSNIEQSVKYGIWATQKHNEDKFVEAYKSGGPVYLIFSVNMSGHFQGYAKMVGMPFKHKQGLWGGGAAVSNSFDVEWVRRYDLAFRDLEHIRNPLNEDKPIKISRDGQELPNNLGQTVCQLFDQGAELKGVAAPPQADRNHDFNVGPAVGGYTSFSRGIGRGGIKGPQPPRGPPPSSGFGSDRQNHGLQPGMVMTPMGPMLAPMAMQMGFGGGGMDFHPHMMGAGGMSNPMMGMNMHGMEQMAAMQAMMGGRMPGFMGGPGNLPGPRAPVPPPKPPPPRSPPKENDYMKQMMENALRGMRANQSDRGRSSRDEELLLMRALELGRRSPPSRDRRRYRSRSRSPSPRRYKSHRRSRSRSRSRSAGRHRDKVADMSYDDYLEAYNALKRVRKEKEEPLDFAGGMSNGVNPMMAQMASMIGGSSKSQRAPVSTSQMSGTMNAQAASVGGGVGNMTEDQYVGVWEAYSKSMGTPFDAATVRGWYRQHKQMSAMKK